MMNKISILFFIVFTVGVLVGGVGGCGAGFGPDLSNLDDLDLSNKGTLLVYVEDQNGVPVNGVSLQIIGSGKVLNLATNSAGKMLYLLAAGTYTMKIRPPNKFRFPFDLTIQIKAEQTTRVDIKLELATVATN